MIPSALVRSRWGKLLLLLLTSGMALAGGGFLTGVATIHSGSKRYLITVEVAATPETRALGLMFRRHLEENQGMLFLHPNVIQGGFWMKNTFIPLSIAFIDSRGRIVDIQDMEPCPAEPCQVYVSKAPYQYALEVRKGYFKKRGVKVGDRVTWRLHGLPKAR